jgi:hypothetical protein
MNKILFIASFLFIHSTFSQASKTILIHGDSIMSSGVFGWDYIEGTHEIKVYTYSHKTVKMLEMTKEQYDKISAAMKSGNKAKKAWEGLKAANTIGPAVVLIVEENTFDSAFSLKKTQARYYHTSTLKGEYVRYSVPVSDGEPEVYEKGVNDIYTDFPFLQKCIELNQSPTLKFEEKYLRTETSKGMVMGLYSKGSKLKYDFENNAFIKLKSTTPITKMSDIPELEGYRIVTNANKPVIGETDGPYFLMWFIKNQEDKDDKRVYKCYTFNTKGEVVNNFTYKNKTSKDWKSFNVKVFDKNGNHCGYLSFFGFDSKAPKELRGEKEDEYDIIYTNLEGQKMFKIRFDNPSEKHFRIMDPFTAFYIDDKFYIPNVRKETMLKRSNEVLILDTSGNLTKGKFNEAQMSQKVESFVYYNIDNENPDWGFEAGQSLWTVKVILESKDIDPPYGNFEPRYRKLNFAKYNKEGAVQDAFTVDLPDSMSRPKIFLMTKDQNSVSYLIKSGGYYFRCYINDETKKSRVVTYTPASTTADNKTPQKNDLQIIRVPETNASFIMIPFGNADHISRLMVNRL